MCFYFLFWCPVAAGLKESVRNRFRRGIQAEGMAANELRVDHDRPAMGPSTTRHGPNRESLLAQVRPASGPSLWRAYDSCPPG